MATKLSPGITTSQTIGPFSHEAWQWAVDASSSASSNLAGGVTIHGVIRDGDGVPMNDAQIESWQPGAEAGEAAHALPGFRRVPSGEQGEFTLQLQAGAPGAGLPIAYITVFARGLVKHQFTAIFLGDDAGLPQSNLLEQVPGARRATLIAAKTATGQYRWDIHMQGAQETVFFDYV